MNALILTLFLFFGLVPLIDAQEELAELPEPSEPPFDVGDLPLESGYTVERQGAPDLNFRIVNNRMRLYWIDEDGLIMEPEVPAVSLRFDERSIRETVRSFHRLKRLADDTGLGSPYLLVVPHRYYVTLLIKSPDSEEVESYRFRYLPSMDAVASPETE
jgi:hypothetical protein